MSAPTVDPAVESKKDAVVILTTPAFNWSFGCLGDRRRR